jgi:hypothetical protein
MLESIFFNYFQNWSFNGSIDAIHTFRSSLFNLLFICA